MASLEKIYSILGFVLPADKLTLSIYFLTFQFIIEFTQLCFFIWSHSTPCKGGTIQKCEEEGVGGGNFFCRFFLAIILLCRIFLGAGYFFQYHLQYRIFCFVGFFPFICFFVIPPPLQMHAKLLVKVNGPFPWGKGGYSH